MKRLVKSGALLTLLWLAFSSCAPGATPAPLEKGPGLTAAVPARPDPGDDWGRKVAEARKEGKLVIYTEHGSEFRSAVTRAFGDKFQVDVEWISGRGTEMVPKLISERRAGLYLADFVITGITTLTELGAGGVLEPLSPLLVLPEVTDPKAWVGGKLHFIDKEGLMLAFFSRTGGTILVNTEMVGPDELRSYRGLLDPKWKNRILLYDPTGSGTGLVVTTVMRVVMGDGFLRELARQEPILSRDVRQQVEWVARGKYPILLGPQSAAMGEFKSAGAPIKHVVPAEGTVSGAGSGIIGLVNRTAHPAAAGVFVNWFLTREGQTVAVKAAQDQSRRLDVTAEYIDSDRRLQPGIEYMDGDSEAMIKKREETRILAREIFAAQLR